MIVFITAIASLSHGLSKVKAFSALPTKYSRSSASAELATAKAVPNLLPAFVTLGVPGGCNKRIAAGSNSQAMQASPTSAKT